MQCECESAKFYPLHPTLKGGGGTEEEETFLAKRVEGGRGRIFISAHTGERRKRKVKILLWRRLGGGGQEKPYPQKRRKNLQGCPCPSCPSSSPSFGVLEGRGLAWCSHYEQRRRMGASWHNGKGREGGEEEEEKEDVKLSWKKDPNQTFPQNLCV